MKIATCAFFLVSGLFSAACAETRAGTPSTDHHDFVRRLERERSSKEEPNTQSTDALGRFKDQIPSLLRGGGEGAMGKDYSRHLSGQQRSMQQRSIQVNGRWKDRVADLVQIPYTIDSIYSSSQKAQIEQSIHALASATKVVKFIPRTNQAAYIKVIEGGGCWSWVGKSRAGKSQELSLQRSGCLRTGTIQHEFLHAMGYHHEMVRPDRDTFVSINFSNIPRKNRHNFEKETSSQVLGSPYDYGSVMHYPRDAFAINRAVDTITPKQAGVTIGQRNGVSTQDVTDVRLLYQCISGPRTLSQYQSSPCTSDCKCWEGASGCNGNNDACQGNLVCTNNQCVKDDGGSTGTGQGSCTDFPNWEDAEGDGCDWYEDNDGCEEYGDFDGGASGKTANEACCVCGGGSLAGATFFSISNAETPDFCIDSYAARTNNGNRIWHYPCNGTPAQHWWLDSNWNLRSALDTDKCIVGSAGSTDQGTNLMIHDCWANDDRFVFYYYTDGTLRPKLNSNQCVGPSRSETYQGRSILHLWDCSGSPHQQWSGTVASRRELEQTREVQEECLDVPLAWYDAFGDNCAWYAEGQNCMDYGSSNKNFGKTANQACCACGGGSKISQEDPPQDDALPPPDNPQSCYDFPAWYDSVGDSCSWYAQGQNCAYYGDQFANEGITANVACCSCGGGQPQEPPPDDGGVPGCSNLPSHWTDADGDNCEFYALDNNCKDFGADYSANGRTAIDACCACGGGTIPVTDTSSEDGDKGSEDGDKDKDGPFCFSSQATVQTKSKGIVRMDSLSIGDAVLTAEGTYSTVYSFGHKEPRRWTEFFQIHADGVTKPLEITADHMLFAQVANSQSAVLVPAKDIKIGDSLVNAEGLLSPVTSIRKVRRQGAYAPLTTTGTIMVDGVAASNYIALKVLKSHVSYTWQHSFAHGVSMPYRVYCGIFGCKDETYDEDTGLSTFAVKVLSVVDWLEIQAECLQAAFIFLIAVPGHWLVLCLEKILLNWMHCVAAVAGYFAWKQMNKKQVAKKNMVSTKSV